MIKNDSRTKIVATLGPASSSKEVLGKLIQEGVDVFRLNFSHSKQEEHLKLIQLIRELNKELNANVAILADLQGPKLRVGEIENNHIELNEGEIITFVTTKCIGTKDAIYMSYQEFPRDVNTGEAILIDDGKIKLEVVETNKKDTVKAKVIYGGPLSSKKGVNLPNTKVSLPSLTEEDISNAGFALDNNVDWIALSFVRKASDILDLKELISLKNKSAGVVAKIEKPEALEEIDEIIKVTDAVMVARGDLGVEVSFDKVPLIQKVIVDKCIAQAKPVIIATQMMESMITSPTPTRAEANDVANAVLDGADALMLSGETSVGKYPVETILSMQKIITATETQGKLLNRKHFVEDKSGEFYSDSVCYGATLLVKHSKSKAIVAFTNFGYTAYKLASYRPDTEVFVFTNNPSTLNKLSLVWGIRAFLVRTFDDPAEAFNESVKILRENELLKEGDSVIHIGTIPIHSKGKANMIKITQL